MSSEWLLVDVPATRFVKTADGFNVGFKVFGGGEVDLLFLWQIPVAFDACFEHPGHVRYWQWATSFARVIGYDRRGLAASDAAPLESFGDRAAWVADAVAVLDAVGVDRVVVQGEGFGGHAALALAASYPERVQGLVLVNSYACVMRSTDYPLGLFGIDDVDALVDGIEATWGTGAVVSENVPHLASGPSFQDFCARFERAACGPRVAAGCVRAMILSDVRDLAVSVSVPALVQYTGDFALVSADHSRDLAERIAGAEFLDSKVDSFWGFDPSARHAVQEFIAGIDTEVAFERELLTVLFTDIVASTSQQLNVGDQQWRRQLEDHDRYVRDQVARDHGRVIKHTGDGHLVVFTRPADAIHAATNIRDGARVYGFDVRAGIHFGEVTVRSDGDITGTAVNIASRVTDRAGAGQVLVSRTVADLIAGSTITLEDIGEHSLKGLPEPWRLFALSTHPH